MKYFNNCHTPSEIKDQYRYWCKKLHPDKGGNSVEFREMQEEYELVENYVGGAEKQNTLPNYFETNGAYEYFRRKVKYEGVYFNHYYRFTQDYGAEILIDRQHINLIFQKHRAI